MIRWATIAASLVYIVLQHRKLEYTRDKMAELEFLLAEAHTALAFDFTPDLSELSE